MVAVLLFNFLRGLPKEEIGADRRPQNGDQRRCISRCPFNIWDDQSGNGLLPRHVGHQHHRDIGKE